MIAQNAATIKTQFVDFVTFAEMINRAELVYWSNAEAEDRDFDGFEDDDDSQPEAVGNSEVAF